MPIITWIEEYSTGNELIDSQHKKWIEILNQSHDQMMSFGKKDHQQIGRDILSNIIDYTRFHFDCEEKWMQEAGYKEIGHHSQLHKDFIARIERIEGDFQAGNPMLNSELIKLIENWLVHHILNEDTKINGRE